MHLKNNNNGSIFALKIGSKCSKYIDINILKIHYRNEEITELLIQGHSTASSISFFLWQIFFLPSLFTH